MPAKSGRLASGIRSNNPADCIARVDLLKSARARRVWAFLCFSSVKVIGDNGAPDTSYGHSKLAAERLGLEGYPPSGRAEAQPSLRNPSQGYPWSS